MLISGYKLFQTPPSAEFRNKSARIVSDFILESLLDLLSDGRFIEVADKPHVINPLSVSTNSEGKKRLIWDRRYVNQYLWKERCALKTGQFSKFMPPPMAGCLPLT